MISYLKVNAIYHANNMMTILLGMNLCDCDKLRVWLTIWNLKVDVVRHGISALCAS